MKKSTSSLRVQTVMVLSGLLLLELSYQGVVFATTSNHALIIEKTATVKITHGPRVQSTTEGEEVIENATGTLIN